MGQPCDHLDACPYLGRLPEKNEAGVCAAVGHLLSSLETPSCSVDNPPGFSLVRAQCPPIESGLALLIPQGSQLLSVTERQHGCKHHCTPRFS